MVKAIVGAVVKAMMKAVVGAVVEAMVKAMVGAVVGAMVKAMVGAPATLTKILSGVASSTKSRHPDPSGSQHTPFREIRSGWKVH